MKIESVSSPSFKKYGYVLENIDTTEVVSYLKEKAKMPEVGKNLYVRDETPMHQLKCIDELKETIYGGSDIEVGYCNGYNSLLNCLEYHTCPEVNVAAEDLVLLLATQDDIVDGFLDSTIIKAFLVKKGEAIVVNPYVFHYSPCKLSDDGFHCLVILSDKTNMDFEEKPKFDQKLWKVNKWLFAHKDTKEANNGAYIGIVGENIKVEY